MQRALFLLLALVTGALLAAGCGDGEDSDDVREIRELVNRINQASSGQDARAGCSVIAPSSIRRQFGSRARCVRETAAILKAAGKQPEVTVETVTVDGDEARVVMEGAGGEIHLIREDGAWYVPIDSGQPVKAEDDTPAEKETK